MSYDSRPLMPSVPCMNITHRAGAGSGPGLMVERLETTRISLFDAPKSPSGLVGHWMSNSNQYEVQRWMYKTPCYPNHRCSSVGNGRENMFLVVVNFTSWYTTQEDWTFSDPSLILCYRSRLRNGKGKHNYTCRSVSNLYKEQLFPAVRHTQ
jgi:hypothetical protein